MKKIVAGSILLLFLGTLLAVFTLPFIVDLNQYKDTILARIEPYVPRDVDFRNIELTLLTGVGAEIEGLTISENPAFGEEDFFRLRTLKIRIQILPLLKGQIKVKKITLNSPVVHLVRNPEGVFNVSDLTGADPTAADPGESAAGPSTERKGEETGGVGILGALLVQDLEIREGTVTYRDEALFPEARPLVMDRLDLTVRDLSLNRPVSVRLAAGLFVPDGQNLHLEGVVGPVGEKLVLETIPFQVEISTGSIAWRDLPRGLGAGLTKASPYRILSGRLRLSLNAEGALGETIRSQSAWQLEDLVLQKAGPDNTALETAPFQVAFSDTAELNHTAGTVEIKSSSLSLNGNRILMKGRVKDYLKTPAWDLELWTEELRPGDLLAQWTPLLEGIPEALSLEGPASVTLRTFGNREAFRTEGRAEFDPCRVRYGDLFQKAAGIPLSLEWKGALAGNRITLKDLQLQLHKMLLTTTGEVITGEETRFGLLLQSLPVPLEGWGEVFPVLAPYRPDGSFLLRISARGQVEAPSVNLQLSSDRIGFRIPPKEGERRPAADARGELASLSLETQAKKRGESLEASGKLNVKKGEVLNVPFGNFLSRFNYDGDRLTLSGLDLRVFQGRIRGAGSYRLKRGDWSFRPEFRGIAVEEILEGLTEYRNLFSGTFSGDFKARGGTGKGGRNRVAASGSFRLTQGELKNFNLVGDVLQTLFQIQNVAQAMGKMKGEIQQHQTTRFDSLDGVFDFQHEILLLKKLHFHNLMTSRATDSDAVFNGKVALDADLLDLKGKVILSPRHSADLVREAEVFNALLNPEKRMVIPLTMKGPLRKPVPSLDTQYIVGAITRYYARKGLKQGLKKLEEELGLPKGSVGESDKPVEDLLRQLFK